MKKFYRFFILAAALAATTACNAKEMLIILNEGMWQVDNDRLTYFEDGRIVSNQWFRDCNGYKLGDTPTDIIQVKDNLIAISVNGSNLIQFIDDKGKAVAVTEDVPNCRMLATDGSYLYVTSYAHEVATTSGTKTFTKGYVAKINASTFKVEDAVEVGWEPEGIALYNGSLFVANSGGYAFQENHDYEKTVSVIDASTMKTLRTINTGQDNLYGKISQSGEYLCINSPGDYYTVEPATVILNCKAAIEGKADSDCFTKLDFPSTYNTTSTDGKFYAVGSTYSYTAGGYEYNFVTIDPANAFSSKGKQGVSDKLPGSMVSYFEKMISPYGLYVNPYTGYIYATDAMDFAMNGSLYQWDPAGNFIAKYSLYINPGNFLALNPSVGAVDEICDETAASDGVYYNLQGVPVQNPRPGQIYILNGKKIIR